MTKVAVTHNEDITKAISEGLNHLDIEPLIKDKVVALKPNDTWASDSDKTACTQSDTLRSAIRYIKQYSPKKIIVSGGAGAAETDEVFRIVGLMQVIDEERVEFFDHNKPPFEEVKLEYEPNKDFDGPQKSVLVNPNIFEYETLIALNQLKVHRTATVTLGMKNIAISYPAADAYSHPRANSNGIKHHMFDDKHSFIVAMIKKFPIDLSITVGHPAMLATGPIGGYAVETGLAISSKDAISCDIVAAGLLGFATQGVRHLHEAEMIGLGETDTKNIEFPALSYEEAVRIFTKKAYGREIEFQAFK